MKKRMVIAFFATSLTAGVSFAADWPVIGTQLYPSAPRMSNGQASILESMPVTVGHRAHQLPFLAVN